MQIAAEAIVKPRILIADDSRIVRATLIKHIEGLFEFREALDGEQAWEALLLDPSIRVVLTDLTMPKLDGYGLLQRIRNSKISRIRELPVVVISGSDGREECERAKAAGATDLITKGIGTAQLLSRLEVLSKLINNNQQGKSERILASSETSNNDRVYSSIELPSLGEWQTKAASLLANATKDKSNFVLLNISFDVNYTKSGSVGGRLPVATVNALGELLHRAMRQTDLMTKTGAAAFSIAAGSIHFDAARHFAQRICKTIANTNVIEEGHPLAISCGLTSSSEQSHGSSTMTLDMMYEIAVRRSALGIAYSVAGIVGAEEEAALLSGDANTVSLNAAFPEEEKNAVPISPIPRDAELLPDMATILQWINNGREDKVVPHIHKLSRELRPLIDLLLKKV